MNLTMLLMHQDYGRSWAWINIFDGVCTLYRPRYLLLFFGMRRFQESPDPCGHVCDSPEETPKLALTTLGHPKGLFFVDRYSYLRPLLPATRQYIKRALLRR